MQRRGRWASTRQLAPGARYSADSTTRSYPGARQVLRVAYRDQHEAHRSSYAASASASRRPTSDDEPAKTYTAPLAGLTAHCALRHSVTCTRGASDTGTRQVVGEPVRGERVGSVGAHGSAMMLDTVSLPGLVQGPVRRSTAARARLCQPTASFELDVPPHEACRSN